MSEVKAQAAKETNKEGLAESYKAKYGKVYRVVVTLEPDDSTSIQNEYFFKKPLVASYDRYIKTTAQSASKALKTFVLDNVVEEQYSKLSDDLEEYPALAISLGEKLLAMLGLSKDVNLRQL